MYIYIYMYMYVYVVMIFAHAHTCTSASCHLHVVMNRGLSPFWREDIQEKQLHPNKWPRRVGRRVGGCSSRPQISVVIAEVVLLATSPTYSCCMYWMNICMCVGGYCMWLYMHATNAIHCNILQHTATYCNTLQHTASHTSWRQEFWREYSGVKLKHATTYCNTLRHLATHWDTLHHSVILCSTQQHTATHCNTLQHTATHSNTLQHTATHCNTL